MATCSRSISLYKVCALSCLLRMSSDAIYRRPPPRAAATSTGRGRRRNGRCNAVQCEFLRAIARERRRPRHHIWLRPCCERHSRRCGLLHRCVSVLPCEVEPSGLALLASALSATNMPKCDPHYCRRALQLAVMRYACLCMVARVHGSLSLLANARGR